MGEVEYWYSDDSFIRAQSVLRRAVGQYASRKRWIYIGLTQQKPEDRFRQHQRKWAKGHQWDKMIVIYHARSFSLMQFVEDYLIDYAIERILEGKYDCELINEIDSQIPAQAASPDGYWIYILVQR